MSNSTPETSRAEELLRTVQRFGACTRAYLRAPHQPYSAKVLKICLSQIASPLSEHYGLHQDLERQRIELLLTCEDIRRAIEAAGTEAAFPATTTNVRALSGKLDAYEKLLTRRARPCSIT